MNNGKVRTIPITRRQVFKLHQCPPCTVWTLHRREGNMKAFSVITHASCNNASGWPLLLYNGRAPLQYQKED
jgi:hypothetical protein